MLYIGLLLKNGPLAGLEHLIRADGSSEVHPDRLTTPPPPGKNPCNFGSSQKLFEVYQSGPLEPPRTDRCHSGAASTCVSGIESVLAGFVTTQHKFRYTNGKEQLQERNNEEHSLAANCANVVNVVQPVSQGGSKMARQSIASTAENAAWATVDTKDR